MLMKASFYSNTSKVYQVHDKSSLAVEESMHVVFDESNVLLKIYQNCVDHSVERNFLLK